MNACTNDRRGLGPWPQDDAKEKAKKRAEEDPRQQEYKRSTEDAEKKRKYAEGCREMLSYECGVGSADQQRAMKLLCTAGKEK